jgi:hypothetical protein
MPTTLKGVRNVNELYHQNLKRLDYLAIAVANIVGSWGFILGNRYFSGAG